MDTLTTTDGLRLHLQDWPLAGARGRVLIVHGLGEHIGRYDALAQALTRAGFAVCGHDQRGHGRSQGPRGGIPAADSLCADLAAVIDSVQRADGAAPCYSSSQSGKSMTTRQSAKRHIA